MHILEGIRKSEGGIRGSLGRNEEAFASREDG